MDRHIGRIVGSITRKYNRFNFNIKWLVRFKFSICRSRCAGANTGAGGNGSNGCALGGVAPLNSAQTNKAITATFGTVSSSSTATNEIYVCIKLTSGQSITAFSLLAASN